MSAARRAQIIATLLTLAGFALTLRVFWPGIFTFDSAYVYSYIAPRSYGDWQSPVMTWLWAVIDPIAPGSASMFLAIAVLYWVSFGLLALALARSSPLVASFTPLLGLTPSAFFFVGIIWRDVLFAVVWLTAAVLAFAAQPQTRLLRLAGQALALALVALGMLLRPNALFAAPVLAALAIWPSTFSWRRLMFFYVPAAVVFAAMVPAIYYGVFDAKREHALQTIFVYDLGGISYFGKTNPFPVQWTDEQTQLLYTRCYDPTMWDRYWTTEPCQFVMQKLEAEKIFGTPELTKAWIDAVVAHPVAYLEHRATVTWTLLAGSNLTMWTLNVADLKAPLFPDNAWFQKVLLMHEALKPTPLFRAGLWLLLCVGLTWVGWRRRATPGGAFLIGVCGSAVVYIATFFAAGVAADFRYALWAVMAALAGIAVALVGNRD